MVLENLSRILENESPRTIQNYFICRFVLSVIDEMPKRFRILRKEFKKIFQGIEMDKSRKIQCSHYVNEYMGIALSKLFIDKYFQPQSKKEVITIFLFYRKFSLSFVN